MMDRIAEMTGQPVETVMMLVAHFTCFPIAIWFNKYRPSTLSAYSRDNVCSVIGVIIVIVCFKWESLHLFLQWLMMYTLFRTVPKHKLGKYAFAVGYGHVLLVNLYKILYRYGDLSLDFTGTLMLGTMKVTSLAFAVEDSVKPKDKLTENQKKYVIEGEVSARQQFNYYFSFIGILFGPFIFYNDHKKFINNQSKEAKSNMRLAVSTLLYGLASLALVLTLLPDFPVTKNNDPDVLASSLLNKHYVLWVTMLVAKSRYYFAWLTGQSLALFAGFDAEEGHESVTATVNPLQIEFAVSVKQFMDNWNIFTVKWLRYTCFERVPKYKAITTFAVSCIWHGFYPGYAFMFLPLAYYSRFVDNKLYKVVRPKFQGSLVLRTFYAVITFCLTTMVIAADGTGFQLLYVDKVFQVLSGIYFYPHVISVILYLVIPNPPRTKADKEQRQSVTEHSMKNGASSEGHRHKD